MGLTRSTWRICCSCQSWPFSFGHRPGLTRRGATLFLPAPDPQGAGSLRPTPPTCKAFSLFFWLPDAGPRGVPLCRPSAGTADRHARPALGDAIATGPTRGPSTREKPAHAPRGPPGAASWRAAWSRPTCPATGGKIARAPVTPPRHLEAPTSAPINRRPARSPPLHRRRRRPARPPIGGARPGGRIAAGSGARAAPHVG